MNVNETIKTPQDLNTSQDKLKQSGVLVPTGFELDLNTTLTHVSSRDELDRVSKNYLQDVKGWVEVATIDASNDFHVLDVNIDFAIVQEVDVKASQIISSFSPLVQQVSTIHDLRYVLTKQHGNYVSEMNKGIKQDHMPLVPSKPHQVTVLLPKEIIHGSILW